MRRQPNDRLFWELAVYFNRYSDLIGYSVFDPFGPRMNVGKGDTYGFEWNATYQLNPRWHLTGSYSFLIEDLDYVAFYALEVSAGTSPRNQFYLQSGWDLGRDVTLDVMFRYVDSLVAGVDKYFVSDIRLAWRPRTNLEVSIVGQNLFEGRHYELSDLEAGATEVEPGVYGMVSWRR